MPVLFIRKFEHISIPCYVRTILITCYVRTVLIITELDETGLITESAQAVRVVHSCNSWFRFENKDGRRSLVML